jgi:DNA-binding Lrp family transcriptional regulator
MIRVSRAGRKKQILKVVQAYCRQYKGGWLPTAKIAHAIGLKASTNVKNILREMEADGLICGGQIEPYYACGYTVQAWTLAVYEQVALPERYIRINGVNWLLSAQEQYKNA